MNYCVDEKTFKDLMPQKEPMLLVDGIISCDPILEAGELGYEVGKRPVVALLEDGSLPSYVLMEVMAQGCAAVLGYARLLRKEPPMKTGLLLAVRGMKIAQGAPLRKGLEIKIIVESMYKGDGYVILNAKAEVEKKNLAEARVTVYSPEPELASL